MEMTPVVDPVEQERVVRKTTVAGLIINLLLAVVKFAGGILGRSQAVIADAVHSLSDMSTDIIILIGVRYWNKPADDTHPHGHRRMETMVTLGIGLILIFVAVELIRDALSSIRQGDTKSPNLIALAAAGISLVVKEALYRWSYREGRRVHSSALIANAWHHRSDALSSLPAALAVGVTLIDPGWHFVDGIGAIAVSLFIVQAAFKIIRPAFSKLVDSAASPEDLDRIRSIAAEVPGVLSAHKVRTRYVGCSELAVDLHIEVDPELSVREGHDISEIVKQLLIKDGPDVSDVVVHLEPYEGNHTDT